MAEIYWNGGSRISDGDGPADSLQPRLQRALDGFVGLCLSEVAHSSMSIRLIWWDQEGTDTQREISIAEEEVHVVTATAELGWSNVLSDSVVLLLRHSLGKRTSRVEVHDGQLRVDFEHGLHQRRVDGLRDMCLRLLDAGELPVTGGRKPHVTLVVDVPTLQSHTSEGQGLRSQLSGYFDATLGPDAARRLS